MVFNLPNGMYSTIKLSRGGLQRVYSEIKDLSSDPDYVAVTYSPELTRSDVFNKIMQFKGKVIMLQRMDLYESDDLIHALQQLDAIVILEYYNVSKCAVPSMRDLKLVMTDDGLTLTVL